MGCVCLISLSVEKLLIREVCVFFFQAEDGIRDLVRSRGLGDVYKRQQLGSGDAAVDGDTVNCCEMQKPAVHIDRALGWLAVSYTHLTLPTSDLV